MKLFSNLWLVIFLPILFSLIGNEVRVGGIDSHNFIVSRNVVGSSRFFINRYDADGYFAQECYLKSISKTHFNIPLSIYNNLR